MHAISVDQFGGMCYAYKAYTDCELHEEVKACSTIIITTKVMFYTDKLTYILEQFEYLWTVLIHCEPLVHMHPSFHTLRTV